MTEPTAALPGARPVRAPRGTELSCRGWQQEAALRMLMNNLDPEVAENPDALVVYGGTGRAARSWAAFDAIVRELRTLADDETLLIQSGKPVGVLRTNEWAPRVLIANSNLVGKWANWDDFRALEAKGLTMYGQMTAGSWIYIGTQGILQGTFETFAEAARRHFGGTLRGTVTLTAGLGGMGGAQPLAVTMNDGVCLAIEVDEARARRRLEIGYVDALTHDPTDALAQARAAAGAGGAFSIALVGNAAEIEPAWAKAGEAFDLVTDQTSAHDALVGYVPAEITLADAGVLRRTQPDEYVRRARRSMADHVRAMLAFQAAGAVVFDYGNNLRAQAAEEGVEDAFAYPGFVPAFIRPQFCEGRGPFRWAALSGDPADIQRTDRAILELFPDDAGLRRWIEMAQAKVPFQGLPARICWLGYGERAKAGAAFNELVRTGEVSAPIVIGRDHLDSGSVASPNRETEAMLDGSDAIADWPLLNALVNTAAGATWVSIHHGGGTGIGYSQHAGMVVVADGTELAARKLERVLTTDPAMGVLRHVDAGYDRAIEVAAERGIHVPMLMREQDPRVNEPAGAASPVTYQLAQFNVARLRQPLDHVDTAEFIAALGPVNQLAEDTPGFVWRLTGDDGQSSSYVTIPGNDDPLLVINCSVWEDVESLRAFVYKTDHTPYLRRRREWFEPPDQVTTVCWWTPAGTIPDVADAYRRLERLRTEGPSEDGWLVNRPRPRPDEV